MAKKTAVEDEAGNGRAGKSLSDSAYEKELRRMQVQLVQLQEWVKHKGLRVAVVFEGRDAAGKGGIIKRISERVSPRVFRVVALPKPNDRERTEWYFQRYVQHLPAAGEVVLFDRSWYNRAGVERVMEFCTDAEYREFLRTCPGFELALVESGIILIKYWLTVSNTQQKKRFAKRATDPRKNWKLSPMDVEGRRRWYEYSRARDAMLAATDTAAAPWFIVDANNKKRARLNCISHLLTVIPYRELPYEAPELPRRRTSNAYDDERALRGRRFVTEIY